MPLAEIKTAGVIIAVNTATDAVNESMANEADIVAIAEWLSQFAVRRQAGALRNCAILRQFMPSQ